MLYNKLRDKYKNPKYCSNIICLFLIKVDGYKRKRKLNIIIEKKEMIKKCIFR